MRALTVVGMVAAGGAIAFGFLPQKARDRLTAPLRRWMSGHVEHMMARLPDNAPPKLIMSLLPKLQAQNDQIIALLREQNELLRERQPAS